MKKVLIGVVLGIVLIGCGNKVETTTDKYKANLMKKVEAGDEKAHKELFEKLGKLGDQAGNGNMEAVKELEKWEKAMK